jgi:8-oxo-dGTP pyrophosphatase MutT (NUDIX family)
MKLTIEHVRRCLAGHRSEIISPGDRSRAAVVLVLQPQGSDLGVLLIRRAEVEGDRWSGHIAFPGGRVGVEDASPRQTAERETLEEVGLDLRRAEYLGRLDDLAGSMAAIVVSAFVYAVREAPPLVLSSEVEQAFWLPVSRFLEAERHVQRSYSYRGLEVMLPAIRVLEGEGPVLWGLTYRFLEIFLRLAGEELPPMPWRKGF